MFLRQQSYTREEQFAYVIQTIRDFLQGTGNPWDWDDFTSVRIGYPELDAVRAFCLELPAKYPPAESMHWCNSEGLRELRRKLEQLESERS